MCHKRITLAIFLEVEFHHEGMLVLQTYSASSRPQPIQVVVAACKSISHASANLTLALYLSCLCVACYQQHLPFFRRALILVPSAYSQSFKS
jgi:hypothetical protein